MTTDFKKSFNHRLINPISDDTEKDSVRRPYDGSDKDKLEEWSIL